MNTAHDMRSVRGVSVVEVLLGVAIASLILVYASHAIVRAAAHGREHTERVRAVFLAEEGIELMRYLRDESWVSLSSMTNGTRYHMVVSTTTIATTTTPTPIEGMFYRTVTLAPAYRATTGDDLVASTSGVSKAVDASTKLVTVTVGWGTPSTTVSLSTYLTDL